MPFSRSASRLYRALIVIVTTLTLHTLPVCSQSSSAALSVAVRDTTGAFVAGASLDVRNTMTNQSQHLRSSKTGVAAFAFLKPGNYQLTVSKDHFADVVVNNLVLNVGDSRRLDVALKVGPENQTVTVDGTGPTLNTTDASVSTVVDQKFVKNMPLNGRSFQDLISMTPGVTTQSPQSNGFVQYQGDFSVNGQRTESNYYTIDGISGNTGAGYANGSAQVGTTGSVAGSTALGTTQSLVSVDALQEFRVSSSTYSAEYGRTPGGQFSMATRSGTNSIHGTAFDYLRNDLFDANNWFNEHNSIHKPPLRQNDFGGTLGGPITIPHLYSRHDKSFFFISYEGLRVVQPVAATTQYVPALSVRNAAPSPTKELLNAFPLPTGPELTVGGALSGLASFVKSYSLPAKIDSTSVRLDQHLGSRASVFFRYSHNPTSSSSRTLSSLAHQIQNSDTYTTGLDVALSNRSSNSFRLGFSRSISQQLLDLDDFGGAVPVSLKDSLGVPGTYSTYQYLPYLYVNGIGTTYITQQNVSNQIHQWNLTDTFATSFGHHQIRAGLDQRHFNSPLNPAQASVTAYFYSRAEMLANTATSVPIYKSATADPLFEEFSAFVQDEWRVAPRFSLSAGLRWEVNPPPTAADGKMAYTAVGDPSHPASISLAPRGTSLWRTSWYNFAPRLGAAWTAHSQPGHETALRAGAGVFFDTGNQTAALGFSGLGFTAYVAPSNVSLPIPSSYFNFSTDVGSSYASSSVYMFSQHLQLPYSLQWNTSLDQSFGSSQVVTLSYVASAGRRLLQERQMYISAYNPAFNVVFYLPNGLTSNYQSLQLKYQRSVAHGLQALASYTWSHSLDYGSTNASYAYTYGNSDFDLRHNLQAGLSWDIPQRRGHSLANAIVGGWGVDERFIVRSAFPITLTGNTLTDPTGARYYSGVNYNPSRPMYLYGKQYPGGKMVNGGPAVSTATAAFALPTGISAGNAPRNLVRTFGATQVNMAARRDFHLVDSLTLQARAEAFNILNHPNFGYVTPTLTSATFGQATKTLDSSLGTMSSLYQQGGPRSMQFALKLIF